MTKPRTEKDIVKWLEGLCTCGAKHRMIDGIWVCTSGCLANEVKDNLKAFALEKVKDFQKRAVEQFDIMLKSYLNWDGEYHTIDKCKALVQNLEPVEDNK